MGKRISITPGKLLKSVPGCLMAKVASASAEILIREGRYGEILQVITGLPLADFSGESLGLEDAEKSKSKIQRKKIRTKSSSEEVPETITDAALAKNPSQDSAWINSETALEADNMLHGGAEVQESLF